MYTASCGVTCGSELGCGGEQALCALVVSKPGFCSSCMFACCTAVVSCWLLEFADLQGAAAQQFNGKNAYLLCVL
jgi:hypothetical protein